MRARFEEVVGMTGRLTASSNLNAEVLKDTSLAIERASDLLTSAQRLQVV